MTLAGPVLAHHLLLPRPSGGWLIRPTYCAHCTTAQVYERWVDGGAGVEFDKYFVLFWRLSSILSLTKGRTGCVAKYGKILVSDRSALTEGTIGLWE